MIKTPADGFSGIVDTLWAGEHQAKICAKLNGGVHLNAMPALFESFVSPTTINAEKSRGKHYFTGRMMPEIFS